MPAYTEDFSKIAPSRIVERQINAIHLLIVNSKDSYNFRLSRLKKNTNPELDRIKGLIHNSWFTELLIDKSIEVDKSNYLRYALHWLFPQLYYSIYLKSYAYFILKNKNPKNHEKALNDLGNEIKQEFFPSCMSPFATGYEKTIIIHNLPAEYIRTDNPFMEIVSTDQIYQHISTLLKSTRDYYIKNKFDRFKSTTINEKTGNYYIRISSQQKSILSKEVKPTTIFHYFYRKRLKSNYREISSYLNADIDLKQFGKSISGIVGYYNLVFEASIAKMIGKDAYEKILTEFPKTDSKKFDLRYSKYILEKL